MYYLIRGYEDMRLRNNLRIYMARDKMNIKEVAQKIDVTEKTVAKMYHESSNTVRFDTVGKICKLFNITPGELFYLEGEE